MTARDRRGQRLNGSSGVLVGLVRRRREIVSGGVAYARDIGLLRGRRMLRIHMREKARADRLQGLFRLTAHEAAAVGIADFHTTGITEGLVD
jgi:hypothetical protein